MVLDEEEAAVELCQDLVHMVVNQKRGLVQGEVALSVVVVKGVGDIMSQGMWTFVFIDIYLFHFNLGVNMLIQ